MKRFYYIIFGVCLFLLSCSRQPEPIVYGKDSCEHCKMTMVDNKFGAEIVTSKGKVFKFDATECMIDFLKDDSKGFNSPDNLVFTIDIALPGTLIDARTAIYLIDKAFKSPMGANLVSFSSKPLAESNLQDPQGRILTWDELLKSHRH